MKFAWTWAQLNAIYPQLNAVAQQHGFVLAVYGPVIETYQAAELELFAVPLDVEDTLGEQALNHAALLQGLREVLKVQITQRLATKFPSLPSGTFYGLTLPDGRQIDLTILFQAR